MQGDRPTTFAAAADTELRRSQEYDPSSLAALYSVTLGFAWATLAVAEELRRTREGNVGTEGRNRPALSSRERELLAFLGGGRTNVEIAESLHISPHTVKDYTMSIYRKLGARNRAEAVRLAQEHGLL